MGINMELPIQDKTEKATIEMLMTEAFLLLIGTMEKVKKLYLDPEELDAIENDIETLSDIGERYNLIYKLEEGEKAPPYPYRTSIGG